jgi:hypothetical protein
MRSRLSVMLVGVAIVFQGNGLANADDLNPPSYRGLPGSTFSHWTYDEPAPVDPTTGPDMDDAFPWLDAPESSGFVPHPDFEDPEPVQVIYEDEFEGDFPGLDFADNFSWQLFAIHGGWQQEFMGRSGVLVDYEGGSWDINNFIDNAPQKFIRLQLTWKPMDRVPEEFFFEVEWFDEDEDVEEFVEDSRDPFENSVTMADGWIHSTFDFNYIEPNPDVEFLGLFPVGPRDLDAFIAVDQVVIDTISIPEPATWALVGAALCVIGRWRRRSG